MNVEQLHYIFKNVEQLKFFEDWHIFMSSADVMRSHLE